MKSAIYCENKNMKSTILQKAIKSDDKRILYKNETKISNSNITLYKLFRNVI